MQDEEDKRLKEKLEATNALWEFYKKNKNNKNKKKSTNEE